VLTVWQVHQDQRLSWHPSHPCWRRGISGVLPVSAYVPRPSGHCGSPMHIWQRICFEHWCAPWKLLRKDLTTLAQTWSVLSYFNLAPTSHTSDLNVDGARLVYGLVMKMDMDLGSFISRQITHITQSSTSRLGFPALITTLCDARGSFLTPWPLSH